MKICQPVRFLVAAATLAFPTIGRATLLVYEPFDYPAGQLSGANGGVGFATAWSGASGFSVQTGNLQANGFVSPGNEAHYLATNYQNIGRRLSGVYDGASGTDLWASYLTNAASSGAFTSLAIGQLQPGNLHVGILGNTSGTGPPSSTWGMDTFGGAGQVFSNVPVVYGQTVLLVAHIQFLTGPDRIDLFVNPLPGAPPSTPSATKTDLDLGQTLQTQGGYIYLAANIGNVLYDDIRIGTTYSDVVPVPEPPGMWLALMAVAGLAVLRTRSNHRGLSNVRWHRKRSRKPALLNWPVVMRPHTALGTILVLAVLAFPNVLQAVTPPSVDWSTVMYTDRSNFPYGLAPDHLGNVFAAGAQVPPGSQNSEFFLAKLDPSGQIAWKETIGLPSDFYSPDYSNCLQLASNGTLLLSGNHGQNQAVVMDFDQQGNRLWTWQMNGYSYAGGTAADAQSNAYVTGLNASTPTGAFLVKLNSAGTELWRKGIGATSQDESFNVVLDGQGNLYVAGGTFGAVAGPNAGSRDVFLSKFNSSGTLQWSRQFGTSQNDVAYGGVKIDASGNLYVSGGIYSTASPPNNDPSYGFLRKFDPDGNQLWAQQFAGDVRDMALDSTGNIYLPGGGQLVEFDPSGAITWTAPPSILQPSCVSVQVAAFDPADSHLYIGGIEFGAWGFDAIASRLTVAPVPEPSTLLLAGVAGLTMSYAVARQTARENRTRPVAE